MAATGEVTYRISMIQASFIVALCVIADVVQIFFDITGILAVASDFVTALVEGFITLWFWWCGVTYTSGTKASSKFFTMFGMSVVEFVPIVDALPALTIGTILLIRSSRAEDRQTHKIKGAASKTNALAMQRQRNRARMAANDNHTAANDNEGEDEYQEAA